MIHVKLLREGWRVTLTVQGHAGAEKNEEGHDLICGSASTLTFALAQRLYHLEQLDLAVINEMQLKEGDFRIVCTATQEGHERMEEAVTTIATGYHLLTISHPNCIDLQEA